MSKAEGKIQRECIELLELRGYWVRNMQVGTYRPMKGRFVVRIGRAGDFDILAISPGGRLLWVECKVPGVGYVRDGQKAFMNDMTRRGVDCVIVESAEELDQHLDVTRPGR